MQLASMKHTPLVFLLAILCFALPFVTVSCQGQNTRFTGIQLATGTTIHQQGLFGVRQDRQVPPVPLVAFALLCSIAGGVFTLLKFRKAPLVAAIIALVADGVLLLMKAAYADAISQQSFGVATVSYGVGFYLTFLFLLAAAVLSFLQFRRLKETPPGPLPSGSYPLPAK